MTVASAGPLARPSFRRSDAALMAVLGFAAFLVTFDSIMVAAVLPRIASELRIADRALGWLAGSYALSFGLAACFMAPLADRWGRRPLLLGGAFVFAASNLLGGWAGSFASLLVYRFIAGVAGALVMPSVWATVGTRFPPREVMGRMSVIWAFISLSMIVGVPLAGLLAGDAWRSVFVGTGALSFLLLLGLGTVELGRAPSAGASYLAQMQQVLGHAGALRALAATFFWNLSLFATFSLVGAFYHQAYGLSTKGIGLAMLFGGLGTFLGSSVAGKLGARLDRVKVVRASALGAAALVLPFTAALGLVAAIALQFAWSFAVGFGAGALSAVVSSQRPSARGTLMSLNSAVLNLAVVVGGAVAGPLLTLAHGSYLLVGGLSSLAALLTLAMVPPAAPPPSNIPSAGGPSS